MTQKRVAVSSVRRTRTSCTAGTVRHPSANDRQATQRSLAIMLDRIERSEGPEQGADSRQRQIDNGRHRGDLCVCRDGNAGDQYLPALARDHGGRSARIECRHHVDDLGLSRDLRLRTIDRRTAVGPVRPADTGPGRALPLRVRHDLVRVRRRPCRPAGRPGDTGNRRLRRHRAVARDRPGSVRWPGAGQDHGIDNHRNRRRAGPFTPGRQCARSFPGLAIGIRLRGDFRKLRPAGLCDLHR